MEELIEEGRKEEKKQKSLWNRFVGLLCCGERNRSCRIYWIMFAIMAVGVGLVLALLRCNASDKCNISIVWSLIFAVAFLAAAGSVCMFSCCPDGCKRGICCAPLCDPSGGTVVSLSVVPFKASSAVPEPVSAPPQPPGMKLEKTEEKRFVLE
jgi:hypothetical protein